MGSRRSRVVAEDVRGHGAVLWSTDGQKLAFIRSSGRRLYLADLHDGETIELLDDVTGLAACAWSPGGRRLAVASMRYGTESPYCFSPDEVCTELYVVDASSGAAQRLTHNSTYERDPVWSPDGDRIAVLSGHNLGSAPIGRDVRVVAIAGSTERLVTNDGLVETRVAWKDEETLLIETGSSRFTLSLADGTRTELAPAPPDDPWTGQSARSPLDGTVASTSIHDHNGRICWEDSSSGAESCSPNAELYLRLPNGRRLRITHSRVNETDLAWSPDGRTLAFQSGGTLMVVDHYGRNLRVLTSG